MRNITKIGNKDIYIKIDIGTHSNNMANFILVVDGLGLGTLSSPTYIPSFINSLNSILLEEVYYCENINIDLFNEIVQKGELENKNNFTLEETFDDFMKRCIRGRENIYFYFKLHEEHFFSYKNIEINMPIIKVINIKSFIDFLEKINIYFNKI